MITIACQLPGKTRQTGKIREKTKTSLSDSDPTFRDQFRLSAICDALQQKFFQLRILKLDCHLLRSDRTCRIRSLWLVLCGALPVLNKTLSNMEASPAQAADNQICMQVLNSVIHNITICQPNSSAAPVINVSAADVPPIPAEEACVNAPPEMAMDENEVRFGTWLFRAFFVFWLWHCNACIK